LVLGVEEKKLVKRVAFEKELLRLAAVLSFGLEEGDEKGF
jgi:hypothetical protein